MSSVVPRVAVLRWPDEAQLRLALRARGMARLLLVADGEPPPTDIDVLEDWVVVSANAAEVEARLAALEARSADAERSVPSIGECDGVLRFGGRWIALGEVETTICRLLVDRVGELVTRAAIEDVAWHGRTVRANTIDRQLHRLRGHLRSLGLKLHTVRGKGYVLEIPE